MKFSNTVSLAILALTAHVLAAPMDISKREVASADADEILSIYLAEDTKKRSTADADEILSIYLAEDTEKRSTADADEILSIYLAEDAEKRA
ncbi:hypothetical protein G7Y89_g11929 [Cudoniella acicularis]|uniref:Uncharacterized protein n=1 Tax=Cudoniella acicularis TaxID=354080 RepID=A0A8H4VXF2_9HELO|nr:hypothetical protein G7Y89_g11929 [Cudoniella acicularis]